MTIRIPNENKQLKQIGNSDVLGNIWSSFNLNLTENLGRIRVSPRCMLVDGTAGPSTLANMGLPVAFEFYDNGTNERIWCIAGARMFYSSGDPDDTFTQDATASTPTDLGTDSDMAVFDNALYVVGNGTVYKYTGSWSTVSTAPNGGDSSICVYAGRLYSTQGSNQIFSVSSADVVTEPTSTPNTNAYTLDLGDFDEGTSDSNVITTIRSASDRIWIATINTGDSQNSATGKRGRIFEWDGVSNQPTRVYYIDSMGALAMTILNDVPYVMDADGRLRKYTGSAFEEVARLPVSSSRYLRNPANSRHQRFIFPRGMITRDGRILMSINNILADGTYNENLPSGVWEYDSEIGLYHKYSIGISPVGFSTRTDFAQTQLNEVGALFASKNTASSDNDGDIMLGATYYTSATAEAYGVFTNNTKETKSKVGYFVTTWMDSSEVLENWKKAYLKYKKLLDSTDRIDIKYRTSDVAPVEGAITWTSTTTFTSTLGLSSYAVGDEVEVTRGTGGGQIEHITAISENAGTYTVTLENAVTGATGTGRARFQKWIYAGRVNDQTSQYKQFSLASNGITPKTTKIQFKVVMYFTGKDELEELTVIHEPHKLLD